MFIFLDTETTGNGPADRQRTGILRALRGSGTRFHLLSTPPGHGGAPHAEPPGPPELQEALGLLGWHAPDEQGPC